MRRTAIAATAAALWLAPAAGASFGPILVSHPATLHTVQTVSVKNLEDRTPSSCIVHGRGVNGTVGRIERKLAPVACEQPPRSEPLAGIGFFFRITH